MDLTFLGLGYIAAGVGAGMVLIGAGYGIGRLAAAALEGTARQPEAADTIRTTMIIAAALIEGIAFLALIICILIAMNFSMPKEAVGKSKSEVKVEQTVSK